MTNCWVTTDNGDTGILNGAYFSPTFDGLVRMGDCTFGGWSGHDIWLDGGNGYAFTGLRIGSSRKNSANTWDGVHVGPNADNVSFTGCHFNANAFSTIALPAPRSADYVESSDVNVSVVGCIAADGGYGTSALVGSAAMAENIDI